MEQRLIPQFGFLSTPDAAQAFDAALDVLADALAEQFLARARAEIARERGIDVEPSMLVPDALPRDMADWEQVLNSTTGGRR